MKNLTLIAALACTALPARPEPAKPDIVLIVIDSVRADHVSCNGYARATTPELDALAKTGANFTQAVASASWTQPSVMSLFTSLPPDVHQRVRPLQPHDESAVTLAQALRDAGYQTVGLTANPMSRRPFGFAKGFDHYDGYTVTQELGPGAALGDLTSPTLNRLAEGALARRDLDRPLFLFVFYMDPHWDYIPPPAFYRMFTDDPVPARRDIWTPGKRLDVSQAERERIIAAYDGEIRYTDTHVGSLLKIIRDGPRGGNTAIAVCADHGEAFWERGVVAHGNNLHEEEIRVPLIIRAPDACGDPLVRGATIGAQVGLIDVAPTLLDFAGTAPPEAWQGRSLRPFLSGGTVPERPLTLDTRVNGNVWRGVRTSRHKVIAGEPFTEPSAAYDLQTDPKEENNLLKAGDPLPDAAAALVPLLKPAGAAP